MSSTRDPSAGSIERHLPGISSQQPKLPSLELLTDIFRKYPEIQAVYLFGSLATGKTHADSDLDLAIFLRNKSTVLNKLALLTDLARQGFVNTDLILLNTDDIILKYEAVCQNRVIYQTDDFDPGATYSLIIRQYLDFLYYLDVQRQAYKRRILSGQE
jgi:predicted nucleotidyltransferase